MLYICFIFIIPSTKKWYIVISFCQYTMNRSFIDQQEYWRGVRGGRGSGTLEPPSWLCPCCWINGLHILGYLLDWNYYGELVPSLILHCTILIVCMIEGQFLKEFLTVYVTGLYMGPVACSDWAICHAGALHGWHREPRTRPYVRRGKGSQWGTWWGISSKLGELRWWLRGRVWGTYVLSLSNASQRQWNLVVSSVLPSANYFA